MGTMLNRLSRSFQLIQQSLFVLRQYKQLLIFPLISSLACFAIVALIVMPLRHFADYQWQHSHLLYTKEIITIILILAVLFICNLIILFCNAALIAMARAYYQQKPVNLLAGFKAAIGCLPQIIAWALFNTTIGA